MNRWQQILSVDLRALALFRIGVGGVLLFDLATRAGDLVAHYTDAGVLPAHLARTFTGRESVLSLHLHVSSEPLAVWALFAVAGVAAACLLLGWQTRVASVVSWVLLATNKLT